MRRKIITDPSHPLLFPSDFNEFLNKKVILTDGKQC